MAETEADNEEHFDEIVREYYEAVESGEDVDTESFIRRHAEHRRQLESFFADIQALEALPGLDAVNPTRDESRSKQKTTLIPELGSGNRVTYIGQYRLLEEVARGGMGVVFKALQEQLQRVVALKMILSGPLASSAEIHRFQREARAAARLQHPNIVSVHEIGRHQGHYFFTMDFIESNSLAQCLREGSLSATDSARMVEIIARAMHYAHGEGVLHRDLKPANILVDSSGQPHITDFGLAKAKTDATQETLHEKTQTGQILGTPSYMSPEQACGKSELVDFRSDVYSLGAILYACLVGRAPFVGQSSLETLHQVLHDDPPPARLLNRRVPKDLETICLKALAKQPSDRYATAEAIADELQRFLHGFPIHAKPIPKILRAVRWARRNPATASLTALLAFLAIFVPTYAILFARHEQRRATREALLRVEADREAKNAAAARDELEVAIRNANRSADLARRSAYRTSLFMMMKAYEKRDFAALDQLLLDSESQQHHHLAGWEWQFLEQSVRRRFSKPVLEASYSFVQYDPTGTLVAFRRQDGPVDIRNAADLKLIRTLPGEQQHYFDWHPTEPWLAVAKGLNHVEIWNVYSGEQIAGLETRDDRTQMAYRGVAWHPSGRKLALGGHHRIDLFDLDDDVAGATRLNCLYWARFLDWHPTKNHLAAGGTSCVQLIDCDTGQRLWHDFGNRIVMGGILWNGAGDRLAAAWGYPRYDVTIYDTAGVKTQRLSLGSLATSIFWDDAKNELIVGARDWLMRWWPVNQEFIRRTVAIHSGEIVAADFNLRTLQGISVQDDGTVRSFPMGDVADHTVRMVIPTGRSRIWRCLWHPSHPDFLALQSESVAQIVDISKGSLVQSIETSPMLCVIDWHPTKLELVSFEVDGNIRRWDAHTGEELQRMEAGSRSLCASLKYDARGEKLMVGAGQQLVGDKDFSVELIDLATGERDYFGSFGTRSVARLSPDGERLVVHAPSDGERRFRTWDVPTKQLISESEEVPPFLEQMDIHPSGKWVASGGAGGALIRLDPETGEFLKRDRAHLTTIRSLSFSPDGERLMTSSDDNTLKLWDSESLQLLATFDSGMGSASGWSADGTKIATCTAGGVLLVCQAAPWDPDWPLADDAAQIEGEDFRRIHVSSGDAYDQEMNRFPASTWSGNKQLLWINGNPGDEICLGFELQSTGNFRLDGVFTTACDYGIVDIYLDGELLFQGLDLFRPGDVTTVDTVDVSLGETRLSAGPHRLRIIMRGCHDQATKYYGFGLDHLRFQRIDP